MLISSDVNSLCQDKMSMTFLWVRVLTAWQSCQLGGLFTGNNSFFLDLKESLDLENINYGWSINVPAGGRRTDLTSRASCCQVFRCPSQRLSFLCSFIPCFQKYDGPMFEICTINSRYSLLCLLLFLKYLMSIFYVPRTVRQLWYYDGQNRQAPGLRGLTF